MQAITAAESKIREKLGLDPRTRLGGKLRLIADGMVFTANGLSFSELGKAQPVIGGLPCIPAGRYYSSDASSPFGPPPLFSSLEFDIREITYPGINGITTKTFGERGLMITASLVYVEATKAACMAMLTADFCTAFVQQARYTVVMPDAVEFKGCKLIRGGANVATWGPALGASCVATVKAVWKQYDVDAYGPNSGS